jgi:hypothetical protein
VVRVVRCVVVKVGLVSKHPGVVGLVYVVTVQVMGDNAVVAVGILLVWCRSASPALPVHMAGQALVLQG